MPSVRIALCQTHCRDGDREGNFARIEKAVREAVRLRADIACFPETCILGWVNPDAHHLAHPIPSANSEHDVSRLAALARQHEVMLCAGLAEKAGGALHDAAVLLERDGRLLLRHRKLNILTELMTPPYTPGTSIAVAATRWGRLGILICADTFRADVLQEVRRQQADLVLAPFGWAAPPDAWPEHGQALRQTVTRAAQTIDAPVVGVDLVGEITHGPWQGRTFGGQSIASDARGRTLIVAADRQPDLVTIDLPAGAHGVD